MSQSAKQRAQPSPPLTFTQCFEGWEVTQRGPGVHMAYLTQYAAREIEIALQKGTPPMLKVWGDTQRYQLVVTLREVPAVQAGSTVPGAGKRSGKTRTISVTYPAGLGPGDVEDMLRPPKCECGADATGGGGHSKWCPLYVPPESP